MKTSDDENQKATERSGRVAVLALAISSPCSGCASIHSHSMKEPMLPIPRHETSAAFGPQPMLIFPPEAGAAPAAPQIVFLLHEILGFTEQTACFAGRLAKEGFTVYAPIMVGQPLEPGMWAHYRNMARVFLGPGWPVLLKNESPAVLPDLRVALRKIRERHPQASIGIIGMCMSGTLPLALLSEENTRIGAVCQPALPWSWTNGLRHDLALSPKDLSDGLDRIGSQKLVVLGFRFDTDRTAPKERFDEVVKRVVSAGGIYWRFPISSAEEPNEKHATFTFDFSDAPGSPTLQRFENLVTEFKRALEKTN